MDVKMFKSSNIILYSILLLLFHSSAYTHQVHYIGVGRDCQVAEELKAFGLRKASYPFDWFVSRNFNTVIMAIEEDFEFFLDIDYLIYREGSGYIENSHYSFLYNHFFPTVNWIIVPNWGDYLPAVQTTQNRRIKRFQDLLNSQDTVVFIRTHCLPEEADHFVKVIKNKYPNLDFILTVVHDREDLKDDWCIPHVLNFYASKRKGVVDWWDRSEWIVVFEHIKYWLSVNSHIEAQNSN
jgi:hypothetical protein